MKMYEEAQQSVMENKISRDSFFVIYITRLSAKDTNGVMKPEVGLPLNLLS